MGWHFRRVSWGKGYATEAARGIIAYGFNTLQLPVLYAVVHPDNKRSIRVTQRLGMTPMGLTNRYYGVQLLLFKLESISLI
ncbi:MAG: GNAT family N-acetyltransferase [Coleofasciculus sp. E1-EBD-02]